MMTVQIWALGEKMKSKRKSPSNLFLALFTIIYWRSLYRIIKAGEARVMVLLKSHLDELHRVSDIDFYWLLCWNTPRYSLHKLSSNTRHWIKRKLAASSRVIAYAIYQTSLRKSSQKKRKATRDIMYVFRHAPVMMLVFMLIRSGWRIGSIITAGLMLSD